MKNSRTAPCGLAVSMLAIALLFAQAPRVAAEGKARDTRSEEERIGHLRWPGGKNHPDLGFLQVGQNGQPIGSVRRGPAQGKAEFYHHHTHRTVVFLVAENPDNGMAYVVVPGFRIDPEPVAENGVPTLRVARVEDWERKEIAQDLKKLLRPRGLENAPINFWF